MCSLALLCVLLGTWSGEVRALPDGRFTADTGATFVYLTAMPMDVNGRWCKGDAWTVREESAGVTVWTISEPGPNELTLIQAYVL